MAPPSMPIEDQQELVTALKEGRDQAFEQLYAALHRRIYNLAARIVGDTDDAADITQEVFIKAYTRIPAHQGELRLEPWLYRVAVNTCYDHLRRKKVRSAAALDEIGEIADTRDELERSQTSSAVSSALQKINPRYRTALVLKELHGLGNAEVAAALGVSQGATNVLLFRARSAFKRAFREIVPAGSSGLSALGLAAYLPSLPVPEALQTAPDLSALAPLAATLAPAAAPLADMATPMVHTAAPLATSALPAAEAGAGLAASAGVLAKIGGAVGAKVAVGVLSVTALAGGSIAVHRAQTANTASDPAYEAAAVVTARATDAPSPATGGGPTADLERHRYAQARKAAGSHGAGAKGTADGGGSGGGTNAQGTGPAGSGDGRKNGGARSDSGGGAGDGSGGGSQGTASGQNAAADGGSSNGSGAGGGSPTAHGNGTGSGTAAPAGGTGANGSGAEVERSGAGAP